LKSEDYPQARIWISGGVEVVMLGYFFVRWGGEDGNGTTVSEETTIWVRPPGSKEGF
jgi:hypothetical protein